jgi:hypothetical protein
VCPVLDIGCGFLSTVRLVRVNLNWPVIGSGTCFATGGRVVEVESLLTAIALLVVVAFAVVRVVFTYPPTRM